MTRRILGNALFLLMTLALSVGASATTSAPSETGDATTADHTRIAEQADRIAARHAELGWFAGNVLVAEGGRVLFQRSYGMADLDAGIPNTPDTLINLGSIAKHFTAVLVLQLVEQDLIALDDTLDRFEIDLPASIASRVTVLHLLRHQAGFADIFTPEYMSDPLAYDTLEKKVGILADRPLLFEPGTDSRYTNYGYILLGVILERITGQSYETLLVERIFEPLGMDRSHLAYQAGDPTQSKRYTYTLDGQLEPAGVIEVPGPDGGIESTPADVLRFYRTLFGSDRLLDREGDAIRGAFNPTAPKWQAFGGGTGISAAVELDLERDVQVVVLANTDELVAERISGRIMQAVAGEPVDPVRLPAKHFVYRSYRELGPERFAEAFRPAYEAAGYDMFIGRAINEAGMDLVERQDWTATRTLFEALAAYFPEAPQAYDSLAYALNAEGRIEAALETFAKALDIDPGFRSDYSATNYQPAEED